MLIGSPAIIGGRRRRDLLLTPGATVAGAWRAEDYTAGDWPDRSGNGHDFVQLTGGDQPGFSGASANFNSRPIVTFNGTGQFLTNGSILVAQPWTLLLIMYPYSSDSGYICATETSHPSIRWEGSGVLGFNAGGGVAGFGSIDVEDAPHVIEGLGAGGSSAAWVDGVLDDADTSGTTAFDGITLGKHPSASGGKFDLAEFVIFSSALSSEARDYIMTYAGEYYGIGSP